MLIFFICNGDISFAVILVFQCFVAIQLPGKRNDVEYKRKRNVADDAYGIQRTIKPRRHELVFPAPCLIPQRPVNAENVSDWQLVALSTHFSAMHLGAAIQNSSTARTANDDKQ